MSLREGFGPQSKRDVGWFGGTSRGGSLTPRVTLSSRPPGPFSCSPTVSPADFQLPSGLSWYSVVLPTSPPPAKKVIKTRLSLLGAKLALKIMSTVRWYLSTGSVFWV